MYDLAPPLRYRKSEKERDKMLKEEGWGWSQIIRRRESLVLYTSFYTLMNSEYSFAISYSITHIISVQ